MSGKRYTDEFKAEAAKQVIEHGRSVREVSGRLGVSIDSLCAWVREQRKSPQAQQAGSASSAEMRRLRPQRILQATLTFIDPALDLRRRQVELLARLQ